MSDTILDFGSSFDTVVAPAGDDAMIASALSDTSTVSDVADAAGATGSDAASNVGDESAGLDMSAPTDIPAPQPDAATPDSGIPAGESSPPVKPMDGIDTTPMQPVQSGPLNSMDSLKAPGLIDSAAKYAKDNPAMAGIVGKALAGAGSGAITALALQNRIKAERDAEERHRQDVIRRGEVPKLPSSTFTPKPGGIINHAAGG
jgi:hypothetical protein